MSLGTPPSTAPTKRPYNINDAETSTNQENIPVPYFAGVAKLTVDWVAPGYNLTSKNVKAAGDSKGKAGGSSGQKNWYMDLAGITNVCPDDAPNDTILFVLVNDEVAFTGPLTRVPGTHYVAFSIPKYCQSCRFYWGTKDQPIDNLVLYPRQDAVPTGVDPRTISTWPRLNSNGDPVDDVTELPGISNPKSGHYDFHPAYRNQGLFVAKQFFVGSSPNAPTIVMVLARGTKFFAGARFEAGATGVNPMGPAFEALTDDFFGCGISESQLVASTFTATGSALDAAGIFLAPAVRNAASARNFFSKYFLNFDGFFRRYAGSYIEAGYFPHGDIDVSALPSVGSDDLVGQPSIKPGSLADTKNSFFVTYTNRAKWWKDDDTEGYVDQANFLKVRVEREDRLERLDIIDGDLAVRHGVEYGSIMAQVPAKGSAVCARERVSARRVGDRFKTNVASLALSFVWRITKAEWPSDRNGTVKFTLENERGIGPAQFIPPAAPKPKDFVVKPSAITNYRVVELPSGELKSSAQAQIAILAQRPSTDILGFKIWMSVDNVTFDLVGTQQHFAAYGKVAGAAYPNSTADLDTTVGMTNDLFGIDQEIVTDGAQTDQQRDDRTLLAFVDNEIMSVGGVTALGSGRFKEFFLRALYGTAKAVHFIGARCWFIFRDWIVPLENKNFTPGSTRYFKLVPFIYGGDYDISLVASFAYTFSAGPSVSAIFNLQLATSARVAAGQIESRISASWDCVGDQDIFQFEVAIKRSSDSSWQTRSVNTQSTDWVVAPGTSYDVKVRPINSHGEPGNFCAPVTIVSASISPFSITGLELAGQGNDTECRERDFKFACRLNSPSSGVSVGGVIQTGVQDPAFSYILWQVFFGGALVYQEQTTVPHFEFTYSKNEAAAKLASAAGPFAAIVLNVYAVDSLRNVSAPAILAVQNSAPAAPTGLSAFAANNRTILLSWTVGPETDLDRTRIYESSSNDPTTATLIATVDSKTTVFVRSLPGVTGSITRYYWVRTVDTFGNASPLSAGATATSDPLAASIADVEDFEIDVTKVFLGKIIVLKGDSWTANSPSAGFIAWNAHQVIFNGVKYDIPAGNTALKYIYWNSGTSNYTPSDTQLTLSSDRFLVYQNVGGTPRGLWNVFANAVIGSANIVDLAVKNAHIENMAVEKLIAGFIVGKQFVLNNDGSNSAAFKSGDYDPGVAGIYFGVGADGKGYLEVNNGLFRGTIVVGAGGATLNDIAAAAALGASDPAARINAGSTRITGGKIIVDGGTNFGAGYDPSTKETPAGAQAKADVAHAAANAAQASANAANGVLAQIASDNLLTPGEKPAVIQDWGDIYNEHSIIDAKATAYGTASEKSDYDSAYNALSSYLSGLGPVAWNDLTGNTTIDGPTFRGNFSDYYYYRQVLLNAIYDAAKNAAIAAAAADATTKANAAQSNAAGYTDSAASAAQAAAQAAAATDATTKANNARDAAIAASLDKATYLTSNTTTIDGGRITTNTVDANRIRAGTTFTNQLYIGALFEMAVGGLLRSAGFVAGSSGYLLDSSGNAEFNSAIFRDGVIIRTLAPPVFVNALDNDSVLTTRKYNDNDNLSMKITAPAGHKVRFESGTDKTVTGNSPFWPNAAGTGDGVGPSDFGGYTINYPLGNDHSRFTGRISACTVSGVGNQILSDPVTLHLTWVPIDLLPLPAATPPFIVFSSGTRGAAGYKVQIVAGVSGADILYSTDGGASYSAYTPGSDITLAANASLMAYNTKAGYSPSSVTTFYNTTRDATDPGWRGPPGSSPP